MELHGALIIRKIVILSFYVHAFKRFFVTVTVKSKLECFYLSSLSLASDKQSSVIVWSIKKKKNIVTLSI
jgi:hypothetical protein